MPRCALAPIVGRVKVSAWLVGVGAALAASGAGCTPPNPVDTTGATETTTGDASTTTTTGTTDDSTGIQTVTSEPTTSTGEPGTTTSDATTTTTGSSSTGVDVCAAPVDELLQQLADPACDVLIQFDETAAPLGFHAVCGATGITFTSGKNIGSTTACCTETTAIYPADMSSPFYVLHYLDLQGPDGVGLLSNHTGRVILDALTGPGGAGPFTAPTRWSDPAELAGGMDCGVPGFRLEIALSVDLGHSGQPLADADLEALVAALGDTALAGALDRVTVERVVVVRTGPEDGGPAHDFMLLSTVSEAG